MSMKWLFNKCRHYEADVSLLVADALAEEERTEVEAHLVECAACRARLAELKMLTTGLTRLGESSPQVEAPASLQRRWMATVRKSARRDRAPVSVQPLLPFWFSSRRLAWGSLAAMWVLVLFFRVSAPDAPKPASFAAAPPSLREVLLALKVEDPRTGHRAEAVGPDRKQAAPTEALPPHSQRLNLSPTHREVA